ncbi:uncharacterized protein IUM83_19823 [Phytophthora cinnamomi]|uniref:uncharacterized protein n=1 Tax=Phytophthora cinnamomi TaxID=4785 RepID=UPI003559583B|nr:hypothetical protein IUM83_19823 [Phytophthora cinnamomi]
MSVVLQVREPVCVRFNAPPAVLISPNSSRLGSRGLTVLHFRPQTEMEQLQQGSSNANFSADFGAGAILPATDGRDVSYEDLLTAMSGLIAFGDSMWYNHARRLLSRLKRFVLSNLEYDAGKPPERVTFTMLHVDKFLDRALAHLSVDSSHWWRDFCNAVRAIDYNSPDWQAVLNGRAVHMVTASKTTGSATATSRQLPQSTRRGPASRFPFMSDNIGRLIPRDEDGREPCQRVMSGGMCYGGCI